MLPGIEELAAFSEWQFTRHYIDECKSGSKIEGRTGFQRMMQDAANGKFDILVVWDVKRFGRDGFDIIASAKTLSEVHGVHVVDCKNQFDTRDRRRNVINYFQAGIAEDERISIKERTLDGKIKIAQKGVPTFTAECNWPYGRTFKKTGKHQGIWGIDKDKQRITQDVARRYVGGEPLAAIADDYRVGKSTLQHRLKRCGPVWKPRFHDAELEIDTTVEITIPALLDDETIQAVRERERFNATNKSGNAKNRYLLSQFLRCGHCGSGLSGACDKGNHYYRHLAGRERSPDCPFKGNVRADVIERLVINELFDCFGNPAAMQNAIAAMQAVESGDANAKRVEAIKTELVKINAARQMILGASRALRG